MKKITYEQLQDKWKNLLYLQHEDKVFTQDWESVCCLYDTDEEDEYMVIPQFDLDSDEPLMKGECRVYFQYGCEANIRVTNPTIRDVANIFHFTNDKSHIFLEILTIDEEDKSIYLFAGS